LIDTPASPGAGTGLLGDETGTAGLGMDREICGVATTAAGITALGGTSGRVTGPANVAGGAELAGMFWGIRATGVFAVGAVAGAAANAGILDLA